MFAGFDMATIWSGTLIALLQVLVIDLVMSWDNALMISMTTQELKKKDKVKAILFGVVGAALLRILFAFVLVHFLQFPSLKIIGGVLLLGIAARLYKQLRNNEKKEHTKRVTNSWWEALGMIVLADISMSLDNVLAIAGAAGHEPVAMIFGILISIILMMTVATVISKLIERFPWLQWLGFAIIVFVAFKLLFAGLEVVIPGVYLTVVYWLSGMAIIFGSIILHRYFISGFETHEIAPFLYRHAPFIITLLLLVIAWFLLFGRSMEQRFSIHSPLWFTMLMCIILLAVEMASLEEVKLKIHYKKEQD